MSFVWLWEDEERESERRIYESGEHLHACVPPPSPISLPVVVFDVSTPLNMEFLDKYGSFMEE